MYLNCKLIFASVLLLVATTTSVFGDRRNQGSVKVFNLDPNEYHVCLPLPARPGYTTLVPSRKIRLFGESQTASRHHIIPFSTLQKLYNLVVKENPSSELGVHIANRIGAIWTKFRNDANAGAFIPGQENDWIITIGGKTEPSFNVDYRMQAAYVWMPGNIFYGPIPARRNDDPHDNFEEGAERIVGRDTFSILRNLNENMLRYINNPSERTIPNFNAIIDDLRTIYAIKRPFEFRESDWLVTGSNKNGKSIYAIKGNRQTRAIAMSDGYMKEVERKCGEYMSQLMPKLKFISC